VITSEWPTESYPYSGTFVAQQVEFLRKRQIEIEVIPFRGAGNPLNYLKAWLRVRRALNNQHYDLVHAHFGHSGLLALPKKIPLVVTFHGSDAQGFLNAAGQEPLKSRLLRRISSYVALQADAAIVVARHLLAYLPPRTYAIIPCGVDLAFFRPIPLHQARQQLGLPQDKRIFFFPADAARPEKRYELALAAIRCVQQTHPEVELISAGSIPFEQMPLYMNACDGLLLTSLHEGSPTVIKEALACNLPIVSVDVGDVRERIGNVPGCVVCQDDTPETIADGIHTVLSTQNRIDGRSFVQHLNQEVLADRIIDVYYEVLR
jgi:glycosyltransferase involved in cell wall biosynthesis